MKIFTTCFCIGFICLPNLTHATELPTVREDTIVDRFILKPGNSLVDFIEQEGTLNALGYTDRIGREIMGVVGAQGTVPLRMNSHSLYRLETNFFGKLQNTKGAIDIDTALFKLGASMRRVINAELIGGGYLLADMPLHRDDRPNYPTMVNFGMEYIYPRYGAAILDFVFSPTNLFTNHIKRFYKVSAKVGILKPNIIDFAMIISCEKYPEFHAFTTCKVALKGQVPIQKWDINQWVTIGGAITYDRKLDKPLNSLHNFQLSAYLQINFLQPILQSSMQGYLRTPIDRFGITPFHPDNTPPPSKHAWLINDEDPRSPAFYDSLSSTSSYHAELGRDHRLLPPIRTASPVPTVSSETPTKQGREYIP